MANGRPAARWLVSAAVLLVAGFFASFGLTSALIGDDEPDPAAEQTPAVTPAPAGPTVAEPTGVEPTGGGRAGPRRAEVGATRAEEEPQAAETVDPIKDAVRAPCSVDEIRFLFDREEGVIALFAEDGRTIASVARDSYVFERELCSRGQAGVKPYSFQGLRAPVYESGGVSCNAPKGVDVEIHPVLNGDTGGQWGNVLLVSVRDRPAVLASGIIVEDLGGRRFSYSSKHCTRL
jgi:hypothetical protein